MSIIQILKITKEQLKELEKWKIIFIEDWRSGIELQVV